jgi:hypothetical protein
MAKTTFSSGVIVTSQWLNGAQQIYFDGQDLDWHYPPLGISSMVTSGTDGLDGRYITLATEQPVLNSAGFLVSGQPISGAKVVTGPWMFGYDPLVNPGLQNIIANAPKSYTTNDKYENANGVTAPTAAQKFAALDDADILTKLVVSEQLNDLLENIEIDNGIYYSAGNPACENYGTVPSVICPA